MILYVFLFSQIWILCSTESTQLLLSAVPMILLNNKTEFVLWIESFPMKTADCSFITSPLSTSSLIGTNHFIIPRSGAMLDYPAWNYVGLPQSHSSNIDTMLFFFLETVSWMVSKLLHSHLMWEQSSEEPAFKMPTSKSSRLAAFKKWAMLFDVLVKVAWIGSVSSSLYDVEMAFNFVPNIGRKYLSNTSAFSVSQLSKYIWIHWELTGLY